MYEQEIDVLRALAGGVNYFTGERCGSDCILNDIEIVQTLYRICDVLSEATPGKSIRPKFSCPADIEEKFTYEDSMGLTQIINKIDMLYPGMEKLKFNQISDILIQKGLLEKVVDYDGKYKTKATPLAKEYGITNKQKIAKTGQSYIMVTYNKDGQKLVLSCLKMLNGN